VPTITTVAGIYQRITRNIVTYTPTVITPQFSNGVATNVTLGNPWDVVEDPVTGDVYIVDQFVGLVRKLDPSGNLTTIAGNNTAKRFSGGGWQRVWCGCRLFCKQIIFDTLFSNFILLLPLSLFLLPACPSMSCTFKSPQTGAMRAGRFSTSQVASLCPAGLCTLQISGTGPSDTST
jgi:hypothetical protein